MGACVLELYVARVQRKRFTVYLLKTKKGFFFFFLVQTVKPDIFEKYNDFLKFSVVLLTWEEPDVATRS